MSRFTEDHEDGVRALAERLEHTTRTCDDCGFEDCILHGDWETHVEEAGASGRIVYRLTCPDCRSVRTVEIDV